MSILTFRKNLMYVLIPIIFVILVLDYYSVIPEISGVSSLLQNWSILVAAFAIGLSVVGLIRYQINHVVKRTPGHWYFAIWSLFLIVTYFGMGLVLGEDSSQFTWVYDTAYIRTQAAIFSLLGFYIVSAAYRVLRVRNSESALLLGTALITILGNAPIMGGIWGGFPAIGKWIIDNITAGVFRAIIMGTAVGLIGLAFRVLIGRERRALGLGKGE